MAWPDRRKINDTWGTNIDALVMLEHGAAEVAEWIEDAEPIQHHMGRTVFPGSEGVAPAEPIQILNSIEDALEHVRDTAAGHSPGMQWNEVDKLKADMMNRPKRWEPVTVSQLRAKCRELNDVDTIADHLLRRKDGGWFKVSSMYRDFHFQQYFHEPEQEAG